MTQENLITPSYLQAFMAASQTAEEDRPALEAVFTEQAANVRAWCLENLFSGDLHKMDEVIDFFQELDWDKEAFQEYEIVELMQENSDSESQQLDEEGSLGSEFYTDAEPENIALSSHKNNPKNLKTLVEACVYHFYNPYRLEALPKILHNRNMLFRDHFFKPLLQAMLDNLIEKEPSRFSEFISGTYLGSDGEQTSAHFSDGYLFEALERFLDLTEAAPKDWSKLLMGIVEVLYVFDTKNRIAEKKEILRACDLITRALQRGLCPTDQLPALFNELCWLLKPSAETSPYNADERAGLFAPLQAALEPIMVLSEDAGSCEAPLVILLAKFSETELARPLVQAFIQKSCPDYLMSALSTCNIDMDIEHFPPLLTLYKLLLEELENPHTSSSMIQSLFDLILEKLTKDQYQEILTNLFHAFNTGMEANLINHLAQVFPSILPDRPLACDYFVQTHATFLARRVEEVQQHSRVSTTGVLGRRPPEERLNTADGEVKEPPRKRHHP